MESTLWSDQQLATELLEALDPHTGNSLRMGITGPPGVGKSTFIEAFGQTLIGSGSKVAVLTVDPTSQVTGGSILGDKTRMTELSREPRAFIRPSPSGQTLGGVTSFTREAILLCEAAGFDMIIVETVGTGQSEIAIKSMVDFFLLLVQPGSGDELQGIKKGIVEMADAIAVTKADGDNLNAARKTEADFRHALHMTPGQRTGWTPRIVTCSAIERSGLTDIRDLVKAFHQQSIASGEFSQIRRNQYNAWFREHFQYMLSLDPQRYVSVTETEKQLKASVRSGISSPRRAARSLLDAYHEAIRKSDPS